jgi:hypothetical protein
VLSPCWAFADGSAWSLTILRTRYFEPFHALKLSQASICVQALGTGRLLTYNAVDKEKIIKLRGFPHRFKIMAVLDDVTFAASSLQNQTLN